MAGSEFTKMVAEKTQRDIENFYDIYGNKFFNLIKMRKGPQMSTDLTEKFENTKKTTSDAASSLVGAVGNAISGAMGSDEVGRMYASGLSPFNALSVYGFRMLALGLTYLRFKGPGGAIDTAKKYGEIMNARGGNGFVAVPLTRKGVGSDIRLGAFDGNRGATNLANMEKMYGDRLGSDIVNGSVENMMNFETELVRSNVVFCDRTVGTLKLNFGENVPDSVLKDVKEELKLRGFDKSFIDALAPKDNGDLPIPNIEQADAESIVHALYRCKAKEEGALVSYLAKDEKFRNLNNQKIAEILRSDRNSVISSFVDENGNWNKKIKESFDRYNTYDNLPLKEMTLKKEDNGTISKWMCLNRLKESGDGTGFVNEVNGIEMPMEFSYMGKDRNKFMYAMEKCGLNVSQKLTGKLERTQFFNIASDPQKGFSMQQYDCAPGMSFEEFGEIMRKNLPNVPWCELPSDPVSGINSVYVPAKSFSVVKEIADQASVQPVMTQIHNF